MQQSDGSTSSEASGRGTVQWRHARCVPGAVRDEDQRGWKHHDSQRGGSDNGSGLHSLCREVLRRV